MAIVKPVNRLTLNDADAVIEVKLYRLWVAKNPPDQTPKGYGCLLLDIQGNAIQADMDYRDYVEHFSKILKLNSAYRISEFFCHSTTNQQQTVPNPISLTLGKIANIEEIEAKDFPDHYFRFISYNQLDQRVPRQSILTDYMSCIQSVENEITHGTLNTSRKIQRDIRLINLSDDAITLTLWNEQATAFNAEEYDALAKPVILAVSSCWVNRNIGNKLQLTSSPATYCYLNPAVPEFFESYNAYKDKFSGTQMLQIDRRRYKDVEIEKNKNRYTLTELMQQNKANYEGVAFTSELLLVEFDDTRTWYYNCCSDPKCQKKILPFGSVHKCPTHGQQPDNFCYCFRAFFTDGPATAAFTFFSEKGNALIGHTCHTLVSVLGHNQKNVIPPEMKSLEGTKHILQFRYSSNLDRGLPQFIVDNIFPVNIEPTSEEQQQEVSYEAKTPPETDVYNFPEKTATATHTPPPSASPTDTRVPATKRALFPETDSPTDNLKKKKD